VPAEALAVARGRQVNKPDWARKRRLEVKREERAQARSKRKPRRKSAKPRAKTKHRVRSRTRRRRWGPSLGEAGHLPPWRVALQMIERRGTAGGAPTRR